MSSGCKGFRFVSSFVPIGAWNKTPLGLIAKRGRGYYYWPFLFELLTAHIPIGDFLPCGQHVLRRPDISLLCFRYMTNLILNKVMIPCV